MTYASHFYRNFHLLVSLDPDLGADPSSKPPSSALALRLHGFTCVYLRSRSNRSMLSSASYERETNRDSPVRDCHTDHFPEGEHSTLDSSFPPAPLHLSPRVRACRLSLCWYCESNTTPAAICARSSSCASGNLGAWRLFSSVQL